MNREYSEFLEERGKKLVAISKLYDDNFDKLDRYWNKYKEPFFKKGGGNQIQSGNPVMTKYYKLKHPNDKKRIYYELLLDEERRLDKIGMDERHRSKRSQSNPCHNIRCKAVYTYIYVDKKTRKEIPQYKISDPVCNEMVANIECKFVKDFFKL